MDVVGNVKRRRWGAGLVAGLVVWGAFGIAPAQAQSVPVIGPPISAIVVGIPSALPSLVGLPGDSGVRCQGGLSWSTSGRTDVDVAVDVNRQPGQAAAG